jgi:hypothetical protein
MKVFIYPLLKTPKGLVPADHAVAEVRLLRGETHITCHDGALREKITEIFNTPITVRQIDGEVPRIFTHRFAQVLPGTEEFMREVLFTLRRYNLHGEL